MTTIHRGSLLVLAAVLLAACGTSTSPSVSSSASPPPAAASTATSASVPASTAGPTEVPTAEPASGPCGNAYQPVAPGDAWTYAVRSTGGKTSYTDTIATTASSSFTVTSDFGRLEKDTRWSCEPDGLVALQYGGGASGSLTAQDLSASFRTTSVTGVTVPRSIRPGDSWNQSYRLRGTIDLGGAKAVVQGSVAERFDAGGVVSVSVPAGTFDVIAIDTSVTLDLQTTVAGTRSPVALTFKGTTYLAKGVGMVESTSATSLLGQEMTTTIELTNFSVR